MTAAISDSIQDYLKIIYELTEEGSSARPSALSADSTALSASTTALAQRLGIAPGSVTDMLQKLASAHPPLVTYQKYQGVALTEAGRRAALEVIRHHRLLEAWLVQTLGYTWDEVHSEAEKLEHVISEEMEMRIASSLGNPQRDPHGEPIPSAELVMPVEHSVLLSSLRAGQQATVRRVYAQDPAFLRHLETLGLIPGARITVSEVSPFDQVIHLQIRGKKETSVLGPAFTERIHVEID
jgi:DtxR family transcriptional regulator, Mn-dependent transcriptional regulator